MAGRFLTRLPFPDRGGDRADLGLSVIYYPLLGLGIGGLLVVAGWLMDTQQTPIDATLVLVKLEEATTFSNRTDSSARRSMLGLVGRS